MDLLGKYYAIRRWYNGWLEFSQTVDNCLLHVRFEELRRCPQKVVAGVANALNLTVHSPLPNVKRRYVNKTFVSLVIVLTISSVEVSRDLLTCSVIVFIALQAAHNNWHMMMCHANYV